MGRSAGQPLRRGVLRSGDVPGDRVEGISLADLDRVLRGTIYPQYSGVIVATAAVRREFGAYLSSGYAPMIIASFGSGPAQVDVRVIAPAGSASYKAAVSVDLQARALAGAQLARSLRIDDPPSSGGNSGSAGWTHGTGDPRRSGG